MISRFRGVHDFLSNFHPCSISWGGFRARSAEHAYQAAKCANAEERKWVLSTPTPKDAKRRGKKVALRPGWEDEKLDVMEQVLRVKFKPGSRLAAKLLATGTDELVEGNVWGDRFWGVSGGKGENHLGKLLMKVRADLATGCGRRSLLEAHQREGC